jgi:phage shock protein E
MKRFILFSLMISAFFCRSQEVVRNVDAATFKKLVDEKRAVLIDLRTTDEITKKGMIKGAIQIDFFAPNSATEIEKLDRNKPYLIYCAGGGRSDECGALMEKLGFKNVVNLEKGYDDWKRKGFETEQKEKN